MRYDPGKVPGDAGTASANALQKAQWESEWGNSAYSFADLLEGDPWVAVAGSPLLDPILKRVSEGSRILEAGCGRGQWVVFLHERGFAPLGVDYAVGALARTRRTYPQCVFLGGNLTCLGFRDETFDAALSWGVVEHFEDGPGGVLKEMWRVLRPGGFLFITVPLRNLTYRSPILAFGSVLRRCRPLRRMLSKPPMEEAFYQYEFTRKQFLKVLDEAGFAVEEVAPLSHEVGLANAMNVHIPGRTRLFQQGEGPRWEGLTPWGRALCGGLKALSPWITPDQIFCIARRP